MLAEDLAELLGISASVLSAEEFKNAKLVQDNGRRVARSHCQLIYESEYVCFLIDVRRPSA